MNSGTVVHVSSAHRVSDVRIHYREAASLARAGYHVHLVANGHDIPLPESGVHVVPLRSRARLARVTLGTLAALAQALRTRAEVFHLHDPELIWAIAPLRLLGKRVIYDAHEDLPVQVRDKRYLNSLTRGPAVLAARLLMRLARRSDLIIAATETIAATFPAHKTVLVRNYPVVRANENLPSLENRGRAVVYLGVMARERGTDAMIHALAAEEFPTDWHAVVAGPTSPPTYLDDLQELSGWQRVDYRGHVSADDARDLLQNARVGIVTLQRTPAYLDSLPTKMFEYFAAGIPTVASDFPLWRAIIEEYDCGLLVDETSPADIARAVRRYADDPELLRRHGENALAASRAQLNWTHEESVLLQAYATLLAT